MDCACMCSGSVRRLLRRVRVCEKTRRDLLPLRPVSISVRREVHAHAKKDVRGSGDMSSRGKKTKTYAFVSAGVADGVPYRKPSSRLVSSQGRRIEKGKICRFICSLQSSRQTGESAAYGCTSLSSHPFQEGMHDV